MTRLHLASETQDVLTYTSASVVKLGEIAFLWEPVRRLCASPSNDLRYLSAIRSVFFFQGGNNSIPITRVRMVFQPLFFLFG